MVGEGLIVLEASGASLATDVGLELTGTAFNARLGAMSQIAQPRAFQCELTCQWATITGIDPGDGVAELYAVPSLDGTNYPAVKLTATAFLSPAWYKSTLTCSLAPTATVDMRFHTAEFALQPLLHKVYLVNRSGQTMTAGWTVRIMSFRWASW